VSEPSPYKEFGLSGKSVTSGPKKKPGARKSLCPSLSERKRLVRAFPKITCQETGCFRKVDEFSVTPHCVSHRQVSKLVRTVNRIYGR